VNNSGLKKLFVFLEKENTRLTLLYDQHRSVILKQFDKQLQVSENFMYNTTSHHGKGLYDNEVAEMNVLLKKPEHNILQELRK
jgi:hypothetical protein